ncbi:MAG: putative cytosolic protein [Gammaproteobacteria bacterium]|jgi:hypothetical protein|nr:putative cytosolic protein [Gammaproteobacteria bacterium]
MKKKDSFDLIQKYFTGWKNNRLCMILSSLHENCVIIESHGPIYYGLSDIEQWFNFWLEANSKITRWDILSFSFCEDENAVFVEWDFSCISHATEYSFFGLSLVKFTEQKISFIHEYRMTRPAYKWEGAKLDSE